MGGVEPGTARVRPAQTPARGADLLTTDTVGTGAAPRRAGRLTDSQGGVPDKWSVFLSSGGSRQSNHRLTSRGAAAMTSSSSRMRRGR